MPNDIDPSLLPDSWKKPEPPVVSGDRIGDKIPACDFANPADLESWYGNFGFCDAFRKVVLSNCTEIERAKATAASEKVSETRLADLARTNDAYVDFLITHLEGRRLREAMVREPAGA